MHFIYSHKGKPIFIFDDNYEGTEPYKDKKNYAMFTEKAEKIDTEEMTRSAPEVFEKVLFTVKIQNDRIHDSAYLKDLSLKEISNEIKKEIGQKELKILIEAVRNHLNEKSILHTSEVQKIQDEIQEKWKVIKSQKQDKETKKQKQNAKKNTVMLQLCDKNIEDSNHAFNLLKQMYPQALENKDEIIEIEIPKGKKLDTYIKENILELVPETNQVGIIEVTGSQLSKMKKNLNIKTKKVRGFYLVYCNL